MDQKHCKSLPRFNTSLELIEFFETRDMGEYWDLMPEAHFDIEIKGRTHLIAIEEEIAQQLTRIAKSKRIASGALVNSWLREKIRKAS